MSMSDDFAKFLSDIEPSSSTVKEISTSQKSMRDYLSSHEEYSDRYQSSYLRVLRKAHSHQARQGRWEPRCGHRCGNGPHDRW